MPVIRHRILTLGIGAAGAVLSLLSCTLSRSAVDVVLPQPSPAATATPDSGDWRAVAPGVERRDVRLKFGRSFDVTAVAVRLDPALVRFEVHYSPGAPYSLNEWQTMLQPVVVVNGGFFDESDRVLGLLVNSQGAFGQSFSGFGGMFQVAAGGVRVRSLVSEPYQGEPLQQAIQSFPMLIETGGVLAPQGDGFEVPSRRSVVGQDRAGRIILIVVPLGMISLADLQHGLLNSDLDLAIAVALDGGRSTGLAIAAGAYRETYPALDQLPSVIAVFSP